MQPETSNTKICTGHLERKAYVYVRQSTYYQVDNHLESQRRQYGLAEEALRLGWPKERIVIVDEDQGKSGSCANQRTGFGRLVTAVGLGEVGIVMSLEASRLSRNSPDWHSLIHMSRYTGTLIADEHGIYDPTSATDRMVLGLRGQMSEIELDTSIHRMMAGRMNKAQRDDADLAQKRAYETLQVTRLLSDPRLIFALVGEEELFRFAIEQTFLADAPSFRHRRAREHVRRLAGDVMRKMMPEEQRFALELSPAQAWGKLAEETSAPSLQEVVPRSYCEALPRTLRELLALPHLMAVRAHEDISRDISQKLWTWALEAEGIPGGEEESLVNRASLEVPRTHRRLGSEAVLGVPVPAHVQLREAGKQHSLRLGAAFALRLLHNAGRLTLPLSSLEPTVQLKSRFRGQPIVVAWPIPPSRALELQRVLLDWDERIERSVASIPPPALENEEELLVLSFLLAALNAGPVVPAWDSLRTIFEGAETQDLAQLALLTAPEYGLSSRTANKLFALFEECEVLPPFALLQTSRQQVMTRAIVRTGAFKPNEDASRETALAVLDAIDYKAEEYRLITYVGATKRSLSAVLSPTHEAFIGKLMSCRVDHQVELLQPFTGLGGYVSSGPRRALLRAVQPTQVASWNDVLDRFQHADVGAAIISELWRAIPDGWGAPGGAGSWVIRFRANGLEIPNEVRYREFGDEVKPDHTSGSTTIRTSRGIVDLLYVRTNPMVVQDAELEPRHELVVRMARDHIADRGLDQQWACTPHKWPGAHVHENGIQQWPSPNWPAPVDLELLIELWNDMVRLLASIERDPAERYPDLVDALAFCFLTGVLNIAYYRMIDNFRPKLADAVGALVDLKARLDTWNQFDQKNRGEHDNARAAAVREWLKVGLPAMCVSGGLSVNSSNALRELITSFEEGMR